MTSVPVTVGMLVCNGERFLRQALDCWVAQDFREFLLIISDDASTDSSPQICKEYASRDPRIRYLRAEQNQGTVWNFNYVFSLAETEYFAWAAQDDLWQPTFLSSCIRLLQENPEAAVVHPQIQRVDATGKPYVSPFTGYVAAQPSRRERFRSIISDWHWCFALYGVYRRDLLGKTRLYRKVYGPDHALMAEVSLYGTLLEYPAVLWCHRTVNPRETRQEYVERVRRGLEPHSRRGSYRYPMASLGSEQLRTAATAPFSLALRLQLIFDVLSRYWVHWVLIPAIGRMAERLKVGELLQKVVRRFRRFSWYRKWRHVPRDI